MHRRCSLYLSVGLNQLEDANCLFSAVSNYCMNSASYEYKKMSVRKGVQFIPICKLSAGRLFRKTPRTYSTSWVGCFAVLQNMLNIYVSSFVRRMDELLTEPAIQILCFHKLLCILGIQYMYGKSSLLLR